MILDAAGNLYGTTESGGSSGAGVVFRIAPDGTGYSVLHDLRNAGYQSFAPLLQASDGYLYGSVRYFGSGSGCGEGGCGALFRLAPDGTAFSVYSCTGSTCGRPATAALIEATDGQLYGTTPSFGPGGDGVVFRLRPE